MPDWLGIALLYLVGSAILISELFLPAHGMMGLVGLGVLLYAVYQTFTINEVAGLAGLVALAVMLPAGLIIAVRNWHRMPIGRRIAPPNPKLTDRDRMPVKEFERLVGRVGRSVTLLRPVGTCVFDGRRVECTAEHGIIEKDVAVEAVRLVDRTLSVRAVASPADDAQNA